MKKFSSTNSHESPLYFICYRCHSEILEKDLKVVEDMHHIIRFLLCPTCDKKFYLKYKAKANKIGKRICFKIHKHKYRVRANKNH